MSDQSSRTNDAGRRVQRMEKEVLQSVAQYLSQGFRAPLPVMITVTHVRMPGDLRTAKIYVSLLFSGSKSGDVNGTPAEIKEVLIALQDASADFQAYIARQLKSRFCPKLTFYQDESTEHVLRVEKILHDLKSAAPHGISSPDSGATELEKQEDEN